jgi:hypothetical protein
MGIGLTEFCCNFNEAIYICMYILIHCLVLISFSVCFNVRDTRAHPSSKLLN